MIPAAFEYVRPSDLEVCAFCSIGCRTRFVREPAAFVGPTVHADA